MGLYFCKGHFWSGIFLYAILWGSLLKPIGWHMGPMAWEGFPYGLDFFLTLCMICDGPIWQSDGPQSSHIEVLYAEPTLPTPPLSFTSTSPLTNSTRNPLNISCSSYVNSEGEGRKGKERKGKEREGREREGKGRKGKEREGKERKGKGRKGKGREG